MQLHDTKYNDDYDKTNVPLRDWKKMLTYLLDSQVLPYWRRYF